MTKPLAWSLSRLNRYRQCPYQFMRVHTLGKEDPDRVDPYAGARSDAMVEGDKMHEAFEHAIKYGAALPAKYAKHSRVIENIKNYANTGEHVISEHQLCIDSSLKAVGWFSKTAWGRAQADVFVHNVTGAMDCDVLVIDFKSGKVRSEWAEQGAVTALLAFLTHPSAQTVRFEVLYVNHLDEPKTITFQRSGMRELIAPVLKTVREIEDDRISGDWTMKTSGLCPWCAVSDCPNHPGA